MTSFTMPIGLFSQVELLGLSYYGANQPPPSPTLTREEEKAAFLRYAKRKTAKDRELLVRQYLCWAFGMASKMKGPRLDFDEAIGVANEGLVEAIDAYNPNLGFRFSTYATFVIRRKLVAAIVNTYPVRISDHLRKKWRAIGEDPEQRAKALLGNEPASLEEFFDRLGESMDVDLAQLHERPEDAPFMPSDSGSPADILTGDDRNEQLRLAIDRLEPLEREVILARHYRETVESYQSIGRRLRVSKSRAREAYDRALLKLRDFFTQEE